AELLEGGEPPLVLDVRGAGEYADGHIAGSLHIPYGELARRLDELPRDRALATICKGGKRSGLAASVLQREGFETIHVARGGVGTWQSEGRPVETGEVPA
ncbi:MAG TPA: rhodanese-like domain-containing protein, partial [Solirubrobacterales bacterium]